MASDLVTQKLKSISTPPPSQKKPPNTKKTTVFFNILSLCNIFAWTQLSVSSTVLSMTKYTKGKKRENREIKKKPNQNQYHQQQQNTTSVSKSINSEN